VLWVRVCVQSVWLSVRWRNWGAKRVLEKACACACGGTEYESHRRCGLETEHEHEHESNSSLRRRGFDWRAGVCLGGACTSTPPLGRVGVGSASWVVMCVRFDAVEVRLDTLVAFGSRADSTRQPNMKT
jgi:hypothetical protein